jgi:hypothetical protein
MYILIILVFISFYLYNKNYDLSLFYSLVIFLLITAVHYSYLATVPILLISTVGFSMSYIHLVNFILLLYVFLSISEFLIHKYVMHADKNSDLSKFAQYIPFLNTIYNRTNVTHIEHHLEVEPDMSLNGNKNKGSLFMGWKAYPPILAMFLVCSILSKIITNYSISYINLFILSIITTFIWEFIWNKVHVKMHNYDIDYSIKEGPYDENLFNLDIVKDILYQNHKMHHLQKGERKGNYNVILLGADEWFGYNNKIIVN